MARKKLSSDVRPGDGPKGRRVRNPIEQRSPRSQATGEYDPEDYHGSGPVPVGDAPVHSQQTGASGIPIGAGSHPSPVGNPGEVPNTGSPSGSGLNREALGDSVESDEALRKASKTAA